jgi:drug/metabolite transporter (DMT)-like permease
MMPVTRTRWLAYAGLLTAMMLWASSYIALKIAFRSYDPMVVIFGRMSVASFCFLFIIKRLKGRGYQKGSLKYILFMVFCEPCLYFIFEAKALENTSASQAGIIAAMLPLLVAAAARFFLKETLTKRTLTGFVIAIVGACCLSITGEIGEGAPNPPLGNFYEFVAMVFATGYIITLKRLTAAYSPFFLTAIQAIAGCGFYMMLLFLPSTTLPTRIDPVATIAVIYLGAIITMGAYGLYNFGVSRIPVSQATAFINLIPIFTVFLGWLILDESLTMLQYGAAVLIFAGLLLSQERGKKTAG